MTYADILIDTADGITTISINRPQVLNAFRAQTVTELIRAFHDAWADRTVGVVILTGVGDRAFSTGGDQSVRGTGGYEGPAARSDIGLDVEELHAVIRDIPKPVIAAVNGWAIGGGNVLQVVCDLTIAAEHARFGQVGPRVGSVDPGFGTAYLARVVGEKKAREMWLLCRQYSAAEALAMGLVNAVVPGDRLREEARSWAGEMLAFSPTALKIAKASFNADTDHVRGIAALGMSALALYYGTEEALEGRNAFVERRKPDFRRFRR
jgi:2-ketocyclohexanecarboxyl-CoA hydrolase